MLTNLCKVGGLYFFLFHLPPYHALLHVLAAQRRPSPERARGRRWLGADDLSSVNWLPADKQLLPLIERELLTASED